MDKRPTSTINFDRAAAVGAPSPAMTGDPNRKKLLVTVAFILAIAIIVCFVAVIVAELIYKFFGEPTIPQGGTDDIKYVTETFSSDYIHKGDLILVKEGYEYVFPSEDETDRVQVYSFKNSSYAVKDDKQYLEKSVMDRLNDFLSGLQGATGFSDVQLYNGYRSFEDQRDKYEQYDDEVSAGYSEHHTGTCFDLNVVGGSQLPGNEEVWAWMNNNAHKYGLIHRYPDDKKDITGVYHDFTLINGGRTNHFRYVGYAHAYYMSQNDLCLEEYLSLISANYSYEGEHLKFTGENGSSYEVYYVASAGTQTDVPVPESYEYTVSGDNMNGFIVTVYLSSPKN